MTPIPTVKSQVTIPKAIRDYLGLSPGEKVSFEPLPDGRVAISPLNKKIKNIDNPFAQFKGMVSDAMTTDEMMQLTRGKDWNQP